MLPITIFKVKDKSMEPTFSENDFVFVNTWQREPKVGDAVVLKHPTEDMIIIKRVVTLGDDTCYVLGDNESESEDSRIFGNVLLTSIIGKVILKV